MKLGIIGAGKVGCACALTAVNRGTAREIVLVNQSCFAALPSRIHFRHLGVRDIRV